MFIAIEGIDGSGKSTAVAAAAEALKIRYPERAVIQTAEPTESTLGTLIRNELSSGDRGNSFDHEMALLFAADRLRHIRTVIEPAQRRGDIVISDRYLFSSLAYQSVTIPYERVRELNNEAVMPDITVFIDVPVDTALERISRTRDTTDVYETRDFLVDVSAQYVRALDDHHSRTFIITVDGSRPADEVNTNMITQLQKHIDLRTENTEES